MCELEDASRPNVIPEATPGNELLTTYPESAGGTLVPARTKLVSKRVRDIVDGDPEAGRY